jgi:hypothetical protein
MWVFFTFVTLVVQNAHGLEVYQTSEGHQIVVFQESNRWIVDSFSHAADGWPEHFSHEVFEQRSDFQNRLNTYEPMPRQIAIAGLGSVVTAFFSQLHSLPQFATELRGQKTAPYDGLWPVTHEWSLDWESEYARWISREFTVDFFVKANFQTACSDVAYALRWIFAREHGLPAANRLTTGEWFTNRSLRDAWRRLPTDRDWSKDRRFLAALSYLTHHTFTHTLWNDSYPIAMNLQFLTPGAYHVNRDATSGHTMIVSRVGTKTDEIPLITLSSTTPRAVRHLNEYMYTENKSDIKHLALLRMRWPQFTKSGVTLIKPELMPGYSLEQFDPSFVMAPRTRFWEEIFFRLNPQMNYDVVTNMMLTEVISMLQLRESKVNEGFNLCRPHRCPNGSSGWEDWSTVSLDQRLRNAIGIFDEFLAYVSNKSMIENSLKVPVIHYNGIAVNLDQAMGLWRSSKYTSDPADSIAKRWGFDQGKSNYVIN